MNWLRWLMCGSASTLVLTAILAGSQSLGMTRMNIPYLLGSMFTSGRDRAKTIGYFVHFANGLVFSLVYVAAFQSIGKATWWLGAAFGLVQAIFVLSVALPLLPALHPGVANEQYGPTIGRQLEPPGFLGLHYGYQTPVSVLIGHAIFGALLGAFYVVK